MSPIFGYSASVAYIFVPDALRQKLDPKALKGVYVGESEEQKASRVFVEATGRTHITRHVRSTKIYHTGPQWFLLLLTSVHQSRMCPLTHRSLMLNLSLANLFQLVG